jgi:hypothetical protein
MPGFGVEVSGPGADLDRLQARRTPAASAEQPEQYARARQPLTNPREQPGCRRGPGEHESRPPAGSYLLIFVTRPAPTVRPPSRIANLSCSSMAIGWISSTDISVLSPGMTISVPSGRVTTPVTSVVRK